MSGSVTRIGDLNRRRGMVTCYDSPDPTATPEVTVN